MNFGEIPVVDAVGSVLAHSVGRADAKFKKGHLLGEEDVARLRAAGVEMVFAVRLGDDDIGEDVAAGAVAAVLAGDCTRVRDAATGRANIMSAVKGVAMVDAERVDRLNLIDESLTVATVTPYDVVEIGQMLATVKVIPFAVSRQVQERAIGTISGDPVLSVVHLKKRNVGLIITTLPGTKAGLVEKSKTSMRDRIEALGSTLATIEVMEHRIDAVGKAIATLARDHDPVLVFGASAIVDRGDVIPAGVVAAGGKVIHLGMPVDPGNLLMLGDVGKATVIGVPSCARSPKINGFDWVLSRVLAGIEVGSRDVMAMGVGGLLQEIASRPRPRELDR